MFSLNNSLSIWSISYSYLLALESLQLEHFVQIAPINIIAIYSNHNMENGAAKCII